MQSNYQIPKLVKPDVIAIDDPRPPKVVELEDYRTEVFRHPDRGQELKLFIANAMPLQDAVDFVDDNWRRLFSY